MSLVVFILGKCLKERSVTEAEALLLAKDWRGPIDAHFYSIIAEILSNTNLSIDFEKSLLIIALKNAESKQCLAEMPKLFSKESSLLLLRNTSLCIELLTRCLSANKRMIHAALHACRKIEHRKNFSFTSFSQELVHMLRRIFETMMERAPSMLGDYLPLIPIEFLLSRIDVVNLKSVIREQLLYNTRPGFKMLACLLKSFQSMHDMIVFEMIPSWDKLLNETAAKTCYAELFNSKVELPLDFCSRAIEFIGHASITFVAYFNRCVVPFNEATLVKLLVTANWTCRDRLFIMKHIKTELISTLSLLEIFRQWLCFTDHVVTIDYLEAFEAVLKAYSPCHDTLMISFLNSNLKQWFHLFPDQTIRLISHVSPSLSTNKLPITELVISYINANFNFSNVPTVTWQEQHLLPAIKAYSQHASIDSLSMLPQLLYKACPKVQWNLVFLLSDRELMNSPPELINLLTELFIETQNFKVKVAILKCFVKHQVRVIDKSFIDNALEGLLFVPSIYRQEYETLVSHMQSYQ